MHTGWKLSGSLNSVDSIGDCVFPAELYVVMSWSNGHVNKLMWIEFSVSTREVIGVDYILNNA